MREYLLNCSTLLIWLILNPCKLLSGACKYPRKNQQCQGNKAEPALVRIGYFRKLLFYFESIRSHISPVVKAYGDSLCDPMLQKPGRSIILWRACDRTDTELQSKWFHKKSEMLTPKSKHWELAYTGDLSSLVSQASRKAKATRPTTISQQETSFSSSHSPSSQDTKSTKTCPCWRPTAL